MRRERHWSKRNRGQPGDAEVNSPEASTPASVAAPQQAGALFDAVYQRLKALVSRQLAQHDRDTEQLTQKRPKRR